MSDNTSVTPSSKGSPEAIESKATTQKQGRLVEHLFAKFAAMYGTKFADQWAGIDLAAVKATWSEAMDGLTREEMLAGIRGLVKSGKPFPPTLPEFYGLCRPRVDVPPVTDHKALDAMAREYGVSGQGCDSYYALRQRIVAKVSDRRALPALE